MGPPAAPQLPYKMRSTDLLEELESRGYSVADIPLPTARSASQRPSRSLPPDLRSSPVEGGIEEYFQ